MENALRDCPPDSLVAARSMAHAAVQPVTRAARANIPPVPDESHTNLAWDARRGAFVSNPIATSGGAVATGLTLPGLMLFIARGEDTVAELSLPGVAVRDADAWLDAQLADLGLTKASTVSHPYELPDAAARIGTYSTTGITEELRTLAAWFAMADAVLRDFAAQNRDIDPGPSPVRCWAHHFDIATLVGLEPGDAESARSIGVGLSPGDHNYQQPYVYVSPWPRLDAATLPPLPGLGHWHTEGFVGAVLTGTELLAAPDMAKGAADFIASAFAIGRSKLGR